LQPVLKHPSFIAQAETNSRTLLPLPAVHTQFVEQRFGGNMLLSVENFQLSLMLATGLSAIDPAEHRPGLHREEQQACSNEMLFVFAGAEIPDVDALRSAWSGTNRS